MSNIFQERNPFDILVRNFLQKTQNYQTLEESKLPHPVDIYEVENGLGLDIACTGIPKEDIEILIEGILLKSIITKQKTIANVNQTVIVHRRNTFIEESLKDLLI